jgi:hypothetical protein
MRILFFIPILLITLFSFLGCEKDDSLDPRPVIVNGQFMRLDITQSRMDARNLDTAFFGGVLTNPGGTAVKYKMNVLVRRGSQGNLSELIFLREITSFPVNIRITPNDIKQAYIDAGIDIGDVVIGDVIRFVCFSYDVNDNKVGFEQLSRTVQSEAAYKQAYRFNTLLTDDFSKPTYNNYEN